MATDADSAAELLAQVRFQATACTENGSPLYGRLLSSMAEDLGAGGPTLALLAPHRDDSRGSVVPLRLMAAVHRLVLDGRAPELAPWFPSAWPVGAAPHPAGDPWPALRALMVDEREALAAGLHQGVQTNEVGRSAALAPGLLLVAARTGLPLRIVEMGASAGLNLRFDRYYYEAADESWGDPASPLRFDDVYDGQPNLNVAATVAERLGCDPAPIDATTEAGRHLLRSFVWPDQAARLARLDAALAIAAEVPVHLEQARAGEWVPARLGELAPGRATVVMHSIVAQYVPKPERQAVAAAIEAAGSSATRDRPVAWLRMEPNTMSTVRADITLRLWDGERHHGEEELLGRTGFHGRPVEWLV